MKNRALVVAEVLLVATILVIAILWVRMPDGDYEPLLALFTALLIPLDAVRRYLRSRKLRVFLSVGATYTQLQEYFVLSFESLLRDFDCERLVVGRDNPPSRQPVLEVRDLMNKADAVIVLAFTRVIVEKATEKPNADNPEDTKVLHSLRYPTVWNQIEAGIAFGLQRPLLIIMEEGLNSEAMLKDRTEFKAITVPFDASILQEPDFKSRLSKFVAIARLRSWFKL